MLSLYTESELLGSKNRESEKEREIGEGEWEGDWEEGDSGGKERGGRERETHSTNENYLYKYIPIHHNNYVGIS